MLPFQERHHVPTPSTRILRLLSPQNSESCVILWPLGSLGEEPYEIYSPLASKLATLAPKCLQIKTRETKYLFNLLWFQNCYPGGTLSFEPTESVREERAFLWNSTIWTSTKLSDWAYNHWAKPLGVSKRERKGQRCLCSASFLSLKHRHELPQSVHWPAIWIYSFTPSFTANHIHVHAQQEHTDLPFEYAHSLIHSLPITSMFLLSKTTNKLTLW